MTKLSSQQTQTSLNGNFFAANILLLTSEVYDKLNYTFQTLIANVEHAILSKNLVMLRSDLPSYMIPFTIKDLIFFKLELEVRRNLFVWEKNLANKLLIVIHMFLHYYEDEDRWLWSARGGI
ncbi:hypothetical protein ACS0TY_034237 [Phlomoides rotata]